MWMKSWVSNSKNNESTICSNLKNSLIVCERTLSCTRNSNISIYKPFLRFGMINSSRENDFLLRSFPFSENKWLIANYGKIETIILQKITQSIFRNFLFYIHYKPFLCWFEGRIILEKAIRFFLKNLKNFLKAIALIIKRNFRI